MTGSKGTHRRGRGAWCCREVYSAARATGGQSHQWHAQKGCQCHVKESYEWHARVTAIIGNTGPPGKLALTISGHHAVNEKIFGMLDPLSPAA